MFNNLKTLVASLKKEASEASGIKLVFIGVAAGLVAYSMTSGKTFLQVNKLVDDAIDFAISSVTEMATGSATAGFLSYGVSALTDFGSKIANMIAPEASASLPADTFSRIKCAFLVGITTMGVLFTVNSTIAGPSRSEAAYDF